MLFNSFEFAIFLPTIYIIYWALRDKTSHQNILLLVSSYFFYGAWDWRFLSLIALSTIVDFVLGKKIYLANSSKMRKIYLFCSLFFNLGILGVFKYYDFFIENFVSFFQVFGYKMEASSLSIILPVGISFYTFQTLSYSIDIYRKRLVPTNNLITFAAFVSFFPQLVAGPIERATNLLPQIKSRRVINYKSSIDGFFQIAWGLFKKIVIGDNCAEIVEFCFSTQDATGSALFLGAFFFSFQIYCDFSGYSDIAIGIAKLFGIQLMTNFRFPYFSRNIGEFWRRWHISLSTWFRDYLYIPLGGSRVGKLLSFRNIMVIFLVSGFWHGANWTFLAWGAIHGLLFLPSFFLKFHKKFKDQQLSLYGLWEIGGMIWTFLVVTLSWVFFRADNITDAIEYIVGIFNRSFFTIPKFDGLMNTVGLICLFFIFILVIVEWLYKDREFVFENISEKTLGIHLFVLFALITPIYFLSGEPANFIYFQF